jgi:hypothetical protein
VHEVRARTTYISVIYWSGNISGSGQKLMGMKKGYSQFCNKTNESLPCLFEG